MKGLIIFIAIIGLSWGQTPCPPAYVLFPCTCSEPMNAIECLDLPEGFNLKEHFDNMTSRIDISLVYASLSFGNSPSLFQISEGAVEHLKFLAMAIAFNPNLTHISPRAFGASRNVIQELYLLGNGIEHKEPRERNIFDFIRSFEKLEHLLCAENGFTFVPDNAFQNLSLLGNIDLRRNNISEIGSRAFATDAVDRIVDQVINLSYNHIRSYGLNEEAFEGISNRTMVDLNCNNMTFMEQKSFQTLLDRARTVNVGCYECEGGVIPCNPVPVEFLYCDERADWICDQKDKYQPKLTGFDCYPGSGPKDIWEYCDGRNGTITNV